MDHRNRNSVLCNLLPDELQALKQLQELQRDRKIVVKPCDKGAGVILMNFEDYLKSCYEHLTSLQSENSPYYIQVSELAIEEAKIIIGNILDEALDNEIITKEEHKAMCAEDKKPGKFYCNYKVHKPHDTLPPPRPIVSGSDSITENIGRYVEHHISSIATEHATYIQDTPDFSRFVEKINEGPKLQSNTLVFTMDAIGLFTNIKHTEGLKSLEKKLETRKNKKIPTDFIIKLMKVILEQNIFEFHDSLWK